MSAKALRRRRGFTLLEVVVTLVIIGAALAAIAGLVAQLGRGSAAPVLHTQGLYLAEGYLEEALLRAYRDPDGVAEGCAVSRDRLDDVGDFNCLNTPSPPTDPGGLAMPGLARYRVSMNVAPQAIVGGTRVRRVEVRITHLDGQLDLRLSGLRADY